MFVFKTFHKSLLPFFLKNYLQLLLNRSYPTDSNMTCFMPFVNMSFLSSFLLTSKSRNIINFLFLLTNNIQSIISLLSVYYQYNKYLWSVSKFLLTSAKQKLFGQMGKSY